jgi:hypothetical protein
MNLNESLDGEFEAFNLSGGQYKKLFGRTLKNVCEIAKDPSLKNEIMKYLAHTNATWDYGTCPIYAQSVHVEDWSPDDLGDYLPAYIPGEEICSF